LHLKNHYPDGSSTKSYTYETVVRRHLDAVAVLLFHKNPSPTVFLRRTLRPPLLLRESHPQNLTPGMMTPPAMPILLEVIAGLLEEADHGSAGLAKRAVQEVWEEAGLRVRENELISLGSGIFPTPGMNPECIYLFACPIGEAKPEIPPGDGSPTEEIGGLVALSLEEAIHQAQQGEIRDAKTEISLHRLKNLLAKER
jgi:8-oxo-dGTP pyrophosphatase MutT (NUDIX family)